jgi:hypothetical protein
LNGCHIKNKNISENLKNTIELLEGIPINKLNCLHWIILSKNKDIFNYVMNNYFKPGSKTEQNED